MEPLEIVQLLGNLGEFLGAIAVFATLLYLAIQVRDAGKAAQFAAVEANRSQRISSFYGLRDSPYMPSIQAKLQRGEDLDAEEQLRLISHVGASWALMYSEWVQRELGVMGEFATSDYVTMESLLRSRSSMNWWRQYGSRIYPARFVEYVKEAAASRESDVETDLADSAGTFLVV